MANETATATINPTDAQASATEASATLLATAGNEAGKQTQTTETPAATATETKDKPATTTETVKSATPTVPEKYEFKAPEGAAFDPGIVEAYSSAAKEAGLSQDAAQKVLEKMAPALAARQDAQVQAIHKEWSDASSADKEFGGEKLKENLGIARKAYDAFDPIPQGQTTTPLRTLLETTGLGNHPEIIRFLYRAGKAISEDHFVGGSAAVNTPRTLAEKLYGPNKS
jgi:hypothetical protein